VVEVEAVGVNPVDLGNRSDPSWAGISPPYVVGYELAGLVVDTGEPVWALLTGPGDDARRARPSASPYLVSTSRPAT
jgi:NADPH:quinone reductase-like Zn-dependent oxidoreductase